MTTQKMDELIYQMYPRKVAKMAAMKALKKAVAWLATHENVDEIQARRILYRTVREYANSPAGKNPEKEYIPHFATWLNRGSYLDDPQEWQIRKVEARQDANKTALDRYLQGLGNS